MAEGGSDGQMDEENLDARILDPAHRSSFILIVNNLGACSFAKLARTCRAMHVVCFNTVGVSVQFGDDDRLRDETENDASSIFITLHIHQDNSQGEEIIFELTKYSDQTQQDHIFSKEQVEKILKMPFRFFINSVVLNSFVEMDILRQYLRRFHDLTISTFTLNNNFWNIDWNILAEIVQEFKVRSLKLRGFLDTPISKDLHLFFATTLDNYEYPDVISDDIVLATTAKRVYFPEARISVSTVKLLLKKFAAGEIFRWELGYNGPLGSSFLSYCSDVMKVAVGEIVEYSLMEPGVFYKNPKRPGEFSLLRMDGSMGTFLVGRELVEFN